ncbi:hypothetical protein TYRP_007864 [Tyrophagus putrescentiae]|nr:hypothetical protein TYRP_007864 [Tyrophagus putrescentiae]
MIQTTQFTSLLVLQLTLRTGSLAKEYFDSLVSMCAFDPEQKVSFRVSTSYLGCLDSRVKGLVTYTFARFYRHTPRVVFQLTKRKGGQRTDHKGNVDVVYCSQHRPAF